LLEFALSCRTLGKRKPRQLVLIHGLFSNGAFWIPNLNILENFQVTLLSVDYAAVFKSGISLREVAERADKLVGEKPAHLIGHSFGSWLGLHLQSTFVSRSFICPTFASLEFHAEPFCSEISRRTAIAVGEIAPLVACAVQYKGRQAGELNYRTSDNFYLPRDDPYFRYAERFGKGATHEYSGGHFDVSGAVEMIADRLTPAA
jgi:hypothetical protein